MTDRTHDSARFTSRVRDFFFAEEVPFGLALVRILLPLVLLSLSLHRFTHTRELYSTDGVIVQLSENFGWGQMLPEFSAPVAVALHTVLIFALVCSIVGFCTRVSLFTAWVLYVYFNYLDVLSTLTKYSAVAIHVLLLLAVSQCGTVWSVDAWRTRRARRGLSPVEPKTVWPKAPVWPARLMQLLLGLMYFGASMTKLQTPSFFSGDQLRYWMKTMVNSAHPIGDYLTLYPSLLGVFAYVTIIWEVLFIFLCWKGVSRLVMLAMGVGFHVGTYLTLGLTVFPLVCLSAYFCFLRESDVAWWAAKLRSAKRRGFRVVTWPAALVAKLTPSRTTTGNAALPALGNPTTAGLCYAALLLVVVTGGVVLEHQLDLYGRNRSEGRYALQPVDPARVAELMSGKEMVEEKDKFFTLEMGTLLVAGSLFDSQDTFTNEDDAIVQCTLNPPHEDMYIECHLRDSFGQLVDRTHSLVGREDLRVTFPYKFTPALAPGEYDIVIRSRGQDVLTKKLFITDAGTQTASAPGTVQAN